MMLFQISNPSLLTTDPFEAERNNDWKQNKRGELSVSGKLSN